jgi:hypothetical protein
LFSHFPLVVKHAIPTIDVASSKRFWRILYQPFTYLWLMGHGSIKPGLRQMINRIIDPRGTRHPIAITKVFYRGCTENSPAELLISPSFR